MFSNGLVLQSLTLFSRMPGIWKIHVLFFAVMIVSMMVSSKLNLSGVNHGRCSKRKEQVIAWIRSLTEG